MSEELAKQMEDLIQKDIENGEMDHSKFEVLRAIRDLQRLDKEGKVLKGFFIFLIGFLVFYIVYGVLYFTGVV